MVRGNWQKRVETAEARRRDAKQRKQRTEEKRVWKGYVHAFLTHLDRHQDVIRKRKCTLHLWTDTLPLSAPPLLDLLEGQNHHGESPNTKRGSGGRGRARSLDEAEDGNVSGGRRGGQGGRRPGDGKKKVHPRSKEAAPDAADESSGATSAQTTPLMKRRDFLYGTKDRRKKGTSKYFQSTNQGKQCTLASLKLRVPGSDSTENDREALLRDVEKAIIKSTPDDISSSDPEAMEMLHYSAIQYTSESDTMLSEEILANLSDMQAPVATIVYIAVDDVLCFDRNRDGMLVDNMDAFTNDLLLSTRRPRQSSVGSEVGEDHADERVDPTRLPGAVLEHLLTFLPDTAVAACCQVCRSWNREIGQHSPSLWLHLLRRHDWPEELPTKITGADENIAVLTNEEKCFSLRILFQNHYLAVRDIQALASAVPAITRQSTQSVLIEEELTYQAFASRKHSPHDSDTCVALEEWAPNHVLAGFSNECTLRLFEATHFRGKEKRCKELVCQSVDPYRLTKKRTCTLDAVGLDDAMIGCLCHVSASKLEEDVAASILVLLSRESFLMGESGAVAAKGGGIDSMTEELQVIDVGEAVLNFILSSAAEQNERLLPLFEYLKHEGGEVGDVCTAVSRRRIVATGHQQFMLEVSISIPQAGQDDENEGEQESLIQLDRKLVWISARRGAIDWIGESYPSPLNPPAALVPAVLGSLKRASLPGGSRNTCFIAVGAAHARSVAVCEVQPSSLPTEPRLVDGSEAAHHSWEGFNDFQQYPSESLIVSPKHVITMDSIYQTNQDDALTMIQSKISFLERVPDTAPRQTTMTIAGTVRLYDMVLLRDEYVVAIGAEFPDESHATEDPQPLKVDSARIILVVVFLSAKQEIGRIGLTPPTGDRYNELKPRFIAQTSGGTLAMALGGLGIAMSGDDVRSLRTSVLAEVDDSPKKKKKPSRSKKGSGKKDGFARGMSLRG
mmetsp:Transcript_22827/g.53928  ORF Transcript_22827/g.53928 Transcript_22827/m.53928 type:complete len:958 (+) Transcript_22827:44-2917(+)